MRDGMSAQRRMLLLIAYGLGGAGLGLALSSIPSPHATTVFWVGNFSSPWPVLAFFAGRSQRSWIWAGCLGALAEVACVVGFYGLFLSLDPTQLGLPRSAGTVTLLATSLGHWVAFIAPWVLIALPTGVLYGLLGAWWARSRSLLPGLALGVPFLIEPLAWPIRNGYFKGPVGIWIGEVGIGVVVLAVMMAGSRRAPPRSAPRETGS
jgi:hypothetical protein